MNAHRKSSFSWKRGQSFPQPYHTWQNGIWQSTTSNADALSTTHDGSFSVLSWNIDFMRSFTDERMKKALSFLQQYASQVPRPSIIMLNEMLVSDLQLIQAQTWVRDQYHLTDISDEFWESGYYGTCVLIPKTMSIAKVFRVHYEHTAMERDGLFIDLAMKHQTVRICCTHLESLVADPPIRPKQLAAAAKFMHEVDASILGGDLNAIQPFDKHLHTENSLKDAYLEIGGEEDAESGMTWGQMAPTKEREKFGLSRMDKLMFCGAVELEHFETFGMDIVVDDEQAAKDMVEEEGIEKPWVTDHLGVRGDFRMISAQHTASNL